MSSLSTNNISCSKYKRCIELFKLIDTKKEDFIYLYKLIIIFFDNKISKQELDQKDVFEILNIYMLIRAYIESINKKIINTFSEEDIQEKSVFDEYDKENGYDDLEYTEENNIYDRYLDILNDLFNFLIRKKVNSLKECLDTNIIDLIDFIKFKLNKDEEFEDYG